jgi:hypothetical protein
MNIHETSQVLAKVAAVDRRNVGDAEIMAWHEILQNFELRDCLDAVALHRRESTEWVQPAHIRKLAMGIRDRRKSAEAKRALPAAPPPARSAEVAALVREVASRLPKLVPQTPADDIQSRAVAMARRLRGRPEPAHRAVLAPKGDTGQSAGLPPKDLETGTCTCGAVYLLSTGGRESHHTVFGHNPTPREKAS